MKNIFDIAKLISKEKVGQLTDEETRQLTIWKESGRAEESAYKRASDYKCIQEKQEFYSKINEEKQWSQITKRIPELGERPIFRLRNVMKWAAIFLLPLLATTYLLNEVYWSQNEVLVEAGSPKASLQLANGKTIYLEDFQGKEIKTGKGKLASNQNNSLVYQAGEATEDVLAYNKISTPVQGEYTLVLSDGTKVQLNAQTSIEYPVEFGKGKRELKLLGGEACFEVAKDAKRPFIVHLANGSEVEVLGTVFNVMAYADEAEIQTTLVEGKVKFAFGEKNVILAPGEQSGLNRNTSKIQVREVDASEFLAWRDGKFLFDKEPLGSVFRKVSRWYGVEVNCKDQALLERRISGVINRYENIDKLISLIEEVSPVQIDLDKREMIVSKK
ncbi:hypothetical protein BZG02_07985 [Labilibaculum filiforme]|uniref:Iron dicitrate transport regulator FecR n=1 Tax=Labilibaculum filiforme TaxID=1940526 RepID=A0A2N3I0W1_9BACT|nr:FecR domain-containing protein [Labilibaculum filiforme]PKQ63942.1 hypothetical protein BZG02_07985 [Labilibaculum filiforme]